MKDDQGTPQDVRQDAPPNGAEATVTGSDGPVGGTGRSWLHLATMVDLRHKLYRGDTRFDIVGQWRRWLVLSIVLVVVGIGSLAVRGLNLGIEFEGGSQWELPAGGADVADARDVVTPFGLGGATIQTVESDGVTSLRVAAEEVETEEESDAITAALEEVTGESLDSFREVGPSWGDEITEKARNALIWFLVLVSVYIAIRFRVKSALPALVALVHDVAITVGVYALGQFPVTPATVIAFLTILGYSLYDTVVVFDKVEENNDLVRPDGNLTYSGMVNLSLNQTLMRTLNTTITALLPVASMLIVGAWIMGAATLRDFALALLVGLIAGAYSSFFVASPLLALLREREPAFRELRKKAISQGRSPTEVPDRIKAAAGAGRAAAARRATVGAEGAAVGARQADDDSRETTTTASGRVIVARPRKKGKRR